MLKRSRMTEIRVTGSWTLHDPSQQPSMKSCLALKQMLPHWPFSWGQKGRVVPAHPRETGHWASGLWVHSYLKIQFKKKLLSQPKHHRIKQFNLSGKFKRSALEEQWCHGELKNGISRELNASPAHIWYNYVPHHYHWQPQVVIKFVLALKNVAQWKR